MFSILFGLHLAIRTVLDWVWRRDYHHGNQQVDPDHDEDNGSDMPEQQALRQNRFNKLTLRCIDRAGRKQEELLSETWTDSRKGRDLTGSRRDGEWTGSERDGAPAESTGSKRGRDLTSSRRDGDWTGSEKDEMISTEWTDSKRDREWTSSEMNREWTGSKRDGEWTGSWRDNRVTGEMTGFGPGPRKRMFQNFDNSGLEDEVVPAKAPNVSSSGIVEETVEPVDVEKVHGYKEMPFLSDEDTVNFIKQSHTMFIMRGLPGSGKSTLVKSLQQIYKGLAVVCSADNFFLQEDGTYKFNADQLSDAHQFCQNTAEYHCSIGTRVVIIDNTNIQRWTMAFYMKLAQNRFYYHVVIVEPQTPWRYHPGELASRNKHNVDAVTISRKLQSLKSNICRPLYYGWFLSKDESSMLVNKCKDVLKQCVDEISQSDPSDSTDSGSFSALDTILNNLVISYTDPIPMLHCTAAYLARRAKDPYHTNPSVTMAIGRQFHLCVTGFVYSKQALSARVCVKPNTEDSFMKDSVTTENGSSHDNETINQMYQCASNQADLSDINQTDPCKINQADLYMKDEEEILREKYSDVHVHTHDSVEKHALFQHGCSAHVTIAYAPDGQSKLSGENILYILELDFYGKVRQKRTSVGQVSAYGHDMFQIELHKPFIVNTLFQGFYSSRR